MITGVGLKDFVKQSLSEIYEAVSECSASNGAIAPKLEYYNEEYRYFKDQMTQIDFDLAVTVSETKGSEDKASVGIISVIGAVFTQRQTNENTASSISRIKFSVPVSFSGAFDKGLYESVQQEKRKPLVGTPV